MIIMEVSIRFAGFLHLAEMTLNYWDIKQIIYVILTVIQFNEAGHIVSRTEMCSYNTGIVQGVIEHCQFNCCISIKTLAVGLY